MDPKNWRGKTVPDSFPIQVDELEQTVRGEAGRGLLLLLLAVVRLRGACRRGTLVAIALLVDDDTNGLQLSCTTPQPAVAAGITQRVLLDYLAEYKYWKQPSGWTLPAFTW